MITLTYVEQVKNGKVVTPKRTIKCFHSMDKAKKFIEPIIQEMHEAKLKKKDPIRKIEGVSYDSKSEKAMLLELRVINRPNGLDPLEKDDD